MLDGFIDGLTNQTGASIGILVLEGFRDGLENQDDSVSGIFDSATTLGHGVEISSTASEFLIREGFRDGLENQDGVCSEAVAVVTAAIRKVVSCIL